MSRRTTSALAGFGYGTVLLPVAPRVRLLAFHALGGTICDSSSRLTGFAAYLGGLVAAFALALRDGAHPQ